MQAIVVFSHLRWEPAWQRPQQLLSRLAKRWRVIYIEEPVTGAPQDRLETFEAMPGVHVWRPRVTGGAPGFHDGNLPALRKLVAAAMHDHDVGEFWAWFYTPMALPLATALNPRGFVYDCMDELSHLTGMHQQLVQRENALFKVVDLVFTGGRSIHNAKKHRHPDVHCFPASVDAKHFAGSAGEHPLHADIPHPRLGYSGVVDDRINLDLLDAIATARPEWNIVMTGPVEKIAPAALPRRDNIHWLGPQGYEDLPGFLRGWDVGLLPYALSEATRSLDPPEPLEYMACGLPAVSTSIRDIVERYGHVVRIADTPEGFIADIEMIMARPAREKERHARELAAIAAGTSWDATADAMAELVAQADELADGAEFMRSQPARLEPEPVPKYLAGAAQL